MEKYSLLKILRKNKHKNIYFNKRGALNNQSAFFICIAKVA
jgi:hypothetical protein